MAAKEESPIAEKSRPEPRWPAVVAILTTGLVYAALPRELSFGPRWSMFVIVAALAGPNIITHHRGKQQLNNLLGYFTASVVTIFLFWSVALLVRSLPRHEIEPVVLLRSAVMLWICNVVIFALWYWRLDAGGPYARQHQGDHEKGAFLFPPMTNDGRRAAGGSSAVPSRSGSRVSSHARCGWFAPCASRSPVSCAGPGCADSRCGTSCATAS